MTFQIGNYPYPASGNYGTVTAPIAITQNTATRFNIPKYINRDNLEGTDIKPTHVRIRAQIGDCLLKWNGNAAAATYDVQCTVSTDTVIAIPGGADYFTLFNTNATPVVAVHFGKDV